MIRWCTVVRYGAQRTERRTEKLAYGCGCPTKKFKRRNIYARFKDNIRAADLAEMESLSSKNKNVKYLLCVIDAFTKYEWVIALKGKR